MAKRIFVVEDHRMLRDGIKMLVSANQELEFAGEAANCAAALEGIRRKSADIFLMDYKLPDGDSISIIPTIKKEQPSAKILIISGSITRALVRTCLLAGADGFISKEDGGEEILRAIKVVGAGETFLSTRAVTVVAEGLKGGETPSVDSLSGQELSVLRGIASGYTYKEIAQRLGISAKSVETYRARLVRKTGLRTKVALTRFAAANEVIVS